jgi:acetolactate synthase-1/2/3 large subunit
MVAAATLPPFAGRIRDPCTRSRASYGAHPVDVMPGRPRRRGPAARHRNGGAGQGVGRVGDGQVAAGTAVGPRWAGRRRRAGAQYVIDFLETVGVPYLVGIPGHGNVNLFDAACEAAALRSVFPLHEQSAAHFADGYARATGRPLAVTTSIGPGAMNTVVGIATAYVDSIPMLVLTGSTHTYLRGHSVLQEIERRRFSDNPRVMEPITKATFQPSRLDELPFVLARAWSAATTGRQGPVLIDLAMDLQAEDADFAAPDPELRRPHGRPRPDAAEVERAAGRLARAQRPVIVAGGGVIAADASEQLLAVAERLGAPVATTWMGKGAIPEDHPLFAGQLGDQGSSSGNRIASGADVLLAVGCRFTDWASCSFRRGATYAIPPTELVQIDIDPQEIGKNYPAAVGLVGDARAALADLDAALAQHLPRPRVLGELAWHAELRAARAEWLRALEEPASYPGWPTTISRALREIRAAAPRETIVVTGAGLPQGQVYAEFPVYAPRTHLTSGGFSTMGFTLPAAAGAKFARPDRPVLAIAGDGDLLQTIQELALLAQEEIPVAVIVLNNRGWRSIRNFQVAAYGRVAGTEFRRRGEPYSPDFVAVARAFGLPGHLATDPADLRRAVSDALACGGPALIEVPVAGEPPLSLARRVGWWDLPVGRHHPAARQRYEEGRREEQLS